MKIIGLTGSIATGKSFIAKELIKRGMVVFDADKVVAEFYNDKDFIIAISKIFPQVIKNKLIDKDLLGKIVFNDEEKLHELEKLTHPLVQKKKEEFIRNNQNQKFVILDIPLLFEAGYEDDCDKIIVTYATPHIQEERALKRPGMSKEKFEAIKSRQMDCDLKILRADYVIDTGISDMETINQLEKILEII